MHLAHASTGHLLFVAGGRLAQSGVSVVGAWTGFYDPAINRWTTTALPRSMSGLYLTTAVWTGRTIVVAGADASSGRLGVADYDPATNQWRMITPRRRPGTLRDGSRCSTRPIAYSCGHCGTG